MYRQFNCKSVPYLCFLSIYHPRCAGAAPFAWSPESGSAAMSSLFEEKAGRLKNTIHSLISSLGWSGGRCRCFGSLLRRRRWGRILVSTALRRYCYLEGRIKGQIGKICKCKHCWKFICFIITGTKLMPVDLHLRPGKWFQNRAPISFSYFSEMLFNYF